MAKSKLTSQQVAHIANLAQLPLSKKEVIKFQKQLADILDYIKILKELETEKIIPTSQVTGLKNVTRPDKGKLKCLSVSEALQNAPQVKDSFFKVKGIFADEA